MLRLVALGTCQLVGKTRTACAADSWTCKILYDINKIIFISIHFLWCMHAHEYYGYCKK